MDQSEVLVVGAGPVGLMAAILLAKNGVAVRVIDREERTATHSYACVLHPRSLHLLHRAGVLEDAVSIGNRIDGIRFYEGRSCFAETAFTNMPAQFPFALVLGQGQLEMLLERELMRFERVEVGWNRRLADLEMKDGGALATIEEFALAGKGYVLPEFEWEVRKTNLLLAQYVIGADGHDSLSRQRLNIPCEQAGGPELFVMYNVECERAFGHEHEIAVVLDQNRLSAMWPFSKTACRWGFQWLPADEPGSFPDKDRSPFYLVEPPGSRDGRHLQALLLARAPWFEGGVKAVDWASDIQLEHWLAADFGRDRCWLAGDAAHQTGPVGMQSMNSGLWEAADLTDKLTRILHEDGSKDLLKEYNRDHLAEWRELLGMCAHPGSAAFSNDWVNEHRSRIPDSIPASGNELEYLLNRLGLDLEHSHSA